MLDSTRTTIDHRQLTLDPTFRHRSGGNSETHLSALRKTLRNTGTLDPVLIWQELDTKGSPTGRLVLLDGHYRVAAYRAEQFAGKISGKGIPAVLLKCNRVEAHLAALAANAKDTLPLTIQERLNAAWGLVRSYRNAISKPRLAKASGVAERTIANMRLQLRKFEEAKVPPDGNWLIDRRFPMKSEFTPPTDEARRHMVEALSKALKVALNEVRTRDVEIIGDALQEALGSRQFGLVADYLGAGDADDDGGTEWMVPDDFGTALSEEATTNSPW
jgi:hypothetical protein